mgnify:CR=1 FL=1
MWPHTTPQAQRREGPRVSWLLTPIQRQAALAALLSCAEIHLRVREVQIVATWAAEPGDANAQDRPGYCPQHHQRQEVDDCVLAYDDLQQD